MESPSDEVSTTVESSLSLSPSAFERDRRRTPSGLVLPTDMDILSVYERSTKTKILFSNLFGGVWEKNVPYVIFT